MFDFFRRYLAEWGSPAPPPHVLALTVIASGLFVLTTQ